MLCEKVVQANHPILHITAKEGGADNLASSLPSSIATTQCPTAINTSNSSVSASQTTKSVTFVTSSHTSIPHETGDVCVKSLEDDYNASNAECLVGENVSKIFTNISLTKTTSDQKDNKRGVATNLQQTTGELISPTEDSSEDHAEIDRTSTEPSVENNRLDNDVMDTRTEDEAPDIDDDVLPVSGLQGYMVSERLLSVEITEDTDITTPVEMRDSHTEKDANTSLCVSGDCKNNIVEDDSINDTNEKDISEFQMQDSLLDENDKDCKEASLSELKDSEVFMSDTVEPIEDTSSKIINVVETSSSGNVTASPQIKSILASEYADVWPTEENRKARRTESTVVETGSTDECSPTDSKSREHSFSDLLDSDEMNRDSLEDEFDKLVAETDNSPCSFPSKANTPNTSDPPNPTSPCSSPKLVTSLSSSHKPTIPEAGTKFACQMVSFS